MYGVLTLLSLLFLTQEAIGNPRSGNIWLQDRVILEKSQPCVLFSYPPRHWNKPDTKYKRQEKSHNDIRYKSQII